MRCHPRERGDPYHANIGWIPTFVGMTTEEVLVFTQFESFGDSATSAFRPRSRLVGRDDAYSKSGHYFKLKGTIREIDGKDRIARCGSKLVEFHEPQKIKQQIAMLTHALYISKKFYPRGLSS